MNIEADLPEAGANIWRDQPDVRAKRSGCSDVDGIIGATRRDVIR